VGWRFSVRLYTQSDEARHALLFAEIPLIYFVSKNDLNKMFNDWNFLQKKEIK